MYIYNKSATVDEKRSKYLGTEPLSEPMLTKIHDTIWRHRTAESQWLLVNKNNLYIFYLFY